MTRRNILKKGDVTMLNKIINPSVTASLAAIVLAGATWVSISKGAPLTLRQEIKVVPVEVRQLPFDADNKAPAVEVLKPILLSKKDNEVEQFSCVVRNNSDKEITAVALALKAVLLDSSGGESLDVNLFTTDMFIHSDIKAERGLRSILPDSSQLMQLPGPVTFEAGVLVKSVVIEVRVAMFDDDTFLGYDPTGSAIARIRAIREGASKYKEWLKAQNNDWKHAQKFLAQTLDAGLLPSEGVLPDKQLKEGADIYRRWLTKVLRTKGVDTASAYLGQ